MEKQTKGYKVTDKNMKCRNYQFEFGKVFSIEGEIKICSKGFHFCEIANDCFNYYDFNSENRVFEIISYGYLDTQGDKHCSGRIEFIRELTWHEVLSICNIGKNNTGRSNTGDWNTGDWNTGYRNTGYRNTGDRNTGDSNTGDWNTGDRNTGDSNTGYRNTGAFCSDNNPKVKLFDVETDILVRDWERHQAYNIMKNYLNPNIWVFSSEMTGDQKKQYPSHETTGGFLKSISMHEAWSNMWHNLSDENKKVFTSLPNFDKDKFKLITGINV